MNDPLTMLTKENIKDIYALSPMQEGLFFHSLLDKSSSAYLEQFSYRLRGALHIAYVEKSLNELLKRYDVLRTVFVQKTTERPIQVVLKERQIEFHYQDLCQCPDGPGQVEAYKQADRSRTFDLGKDVLMRVAVFRLSEKEHEFIWTFHHILLDGWCLAILNGEFFQLYYSLLEGRPHGLGPVKPYVDYIRWLEKRDQQQAKVYWQDYLKGYRNALVIPGKVRTARPERGYAGAQYVCRLEREKTGRLVRFPGQYQVTVSSVVQAAWALLLGRYNQADDVVFGTVVSGRPAEVTGVESMVGLFVNSVPVRIRMGAGETFLELVRRVQAEALSGEPFHYYPLASIQAGSEQKQGLIDHLLVYENFPVGKSAGEATANPDAVTVTGVEVFEQIHYDFNLICTEDEELTLKFAYNANAYEAALVEQMAGHFLRVLEQVTDHAGIRLDAIDILPAGEKARVLSLAAGPAVAFPADKTIQALFEARAGHTPGAVAVRYQDRELTYAQLNERANRLAHYLRRHYHVQPDDLVALVNARSEWMPVAILGILKAGAAYVPVDADCPAGRLAFILDDTRARAVITTSDPGAGALNAAALCAYGIAERCPVLDLAAAWPEVAACPADDPRVPVAATHLAYVIFTSGSTGTPKGVMVEHRGPVNLALDVISQLGVSAQDNVLQFSSLAFDVSVCEILMAFFTGATLTMVDKPTIQDGPRFLRYLADHQVTIALLTPSFLSVFEVDQLSFLRVVISAGEAINVRQAVAGSRYFRTLNGYGPTECSILATTYEVTARDEGSTVIPIGRPVANTHVYILDEANRPVPIGIPGEICLGGVGLARGYVNREELTEARFVDNPFRPGEKLYRTGDVGRWGADGNVEYLGRKDNQVKLRGYRIELSEIGHVLKNHESITDAVVLCRPGDGGGELAGYYTARHELDPARVRQYLHQHLPPYMVPAVLVQLPAFPRNSSGKIDTTALPALHPAGTDGEAGFTPPQGPVEEKLADIWRRTLKTERIGVHDNYFVIGGNSINLIKAYNLIQQEFPEAQLEVADLFKGYTIAVLSGIIEEKCSRAAQPESEFYSLEL